MTFQSLFHKTLFFKAVADQLGGHGHEVYWVCTSPKWTANLLSQGVDRSQILLLRRDHSHLSTSDDRTAAEIISGLESRNGLTLKKLYYMDRIVSRWPWEEAKQYFTYVATRLTDFLSLKRPDVFLGEGTTADGILSALVCDNLNIPFYNLGTIRIPSDRFAFFKGYLMEEYELIATPGLPSHFSEMVERVRQRVLAGERPNYWHWNNKIPRITPSMLVRMCEKVVEATTEARVDATVKPLSYHLFHQRQYLKPLRHALVRRTRIFEKPPTGGRFVLYTLHRQPESSIDVLGADFANQYELVKAIARYLPSDLSLYVKEHPNCLGDRSRAYLKRIKDIPGVRMICPSADTHSLIRQSEGVLSVSGTVAFESALMGKKAGVFSAMYFGRLANIWHLHSVQDVPKWLKQAPDDRPWDSRDATAMTHILANSCEGVIGDPRTNPGCMEPQNILNVSTAVERLLAGMERHLPAASS